MTIDSSVHLTGLHISPPPCFSVWQRRPQSNLPNICMCAASDRLECRSSGLSLTRQRMHTVVL